MELFSIRIQRTFQLVSTDGTNYPHVGETFKAFSTMALSVNEGYLLRSMAIIHSFALEIKSSIANEIDDLFTQLGSEIVEYFSEK